MKHAYKQPPMKPKQDDMQKSMTNKNAHAGQMKQMMKKKMKGV